MAKDWAIGLLALGWIAAPAAAESQPQALAPSGELLCANLKTIELAARDDFRALFGKPRKRIPLLSGPAVYNTTLALPQADDCYIRPSALRGRHEYYCVWHSEKPDFAAADYARRVAFCLDADLSQSDFTSNMVAVTHAKVSFSVGSDNKWDHYQIRLLVDGPNF